MSLPFLPRSVKNKAKPNRIQSATKASEPGPSRIPPPIPVEKESVNVEKSPRYSEEDYTSLVTLALSDYALFLDPEIRRKIDQADDGFIPLLPVIDQYNVPEPAVSKALRSHAADTFDVRLVLSAPNWSSWNAHGSSKRAGMFDLRRKRPLRTTATTRDDWRKRTIYIENIPVQYVSIHGIFRLVQALLSRSSTLNPTSERVQGISFLAHHKDAPSDAPKPKPFALVTLQTLEDVKQILADWPWERTSAPESTTPEIKEAAKFGLRCLSQERWDLLREEYIAHRARLVAEMVGQQDSVPPPARLTKRMRSISPRPIRDADYGNDNAGLSPDSAFPPNCLVFVKNVHAGTNKTALRSLFSQALPDGNGLDYVDYNKGMDTCHLRLANPNDAEALVAWFSSRRWAQQSGLDDTGGDDRSPHIQMEVVRGRQEEIYWEKVPFKVRMDAVEKAMQSRPSKRLRTSSGSESLSYDSLFPPKCLIFVKNVNPGTNKTTLRALFSQALPNGLGLDYVDYNKGMDTCHLRLATPNHAHTLSTWFGEHCIAQETGLDGMGVNAKEHIQLEIVLGRPEELYWEKVPLKVRREAVEKALASQSGQDGTQDSSLKKKSRKR